MALTQDCKIYEYGVPDGGGGQLTSWPVHSTAQLYSGAVTLVRSGLVINAASPNSTDKVVGMNSGPAGGTAVQTGPGFLGGATDGAVWVNSQNGSFFFQSGTGADALTEALVGTTVFYQGENSSGPIAAATNGGSTRPNLGILLPQDPGIAGSCTPGSAYWPVKLNTVGGP